MQEREQKWDALHEDDKLLGAGIRNMIAKTMKGVGQGQQERERENKRQMTARTDGGGLVASQHADTTREEEPEKRQQLQQQPKPKLELKLQLKNATRAQAKVSAHTRSTVGDHPTPSVESEGTRRPRPRPDGWIEDCGEMPDIKKRRERTALQYNGPGNCVSNQQSALPPEGTGPL